MFRKGQGRKVYKTNNRILNAFIVTILTIVSSNRIHFLSFINFISVMQNSNILFYFYGIYTILLQYQHVSNNNKNLEHSKVEVKANFITLILSSYGTRRT